MTADYSKPVTTDLYTGILESIRDSFDSLVRMDQSASLNIPTDSIQWNETNKRFEKWNATTWNALMPSATTSQEGLVQLSNSTSSTSQTLGATASAVKSVYDFAALLASTSAAGRVQLSTSTSSTSTTLAATPSAVKAAYDLANTANSGLSGKANTSGTYSSLRAQATTKADVGLSNVPNYVATSSTTTNSSSQLATASGVYNTARYLPKTAAYNGVGQIAMLIDSTAQNGTKAIGSTVTGWKFVNLTYVSANNNEYKRIEVNSVGSTASGTWRILTGAVGNNAAYGINGAMSWCALAVRIS